MHTLSSIGQKLNDQPEDERSQFAKAYLWRLREGLTAEKIGPLDSISCQNYPTGAHLYDVPKPLRDEQNAWLKTRYLKQLTHQSDGVPLSYLVKTVEPEVATGPISERTYANTAYRRAKRFCETSEYVEIRKERPSPEHEGIWTAYPTPSAFHLIRFKQNSYQDRKGLTSRYIDRIPYMREKADAQFISKQYLGYIESINDKRLMLEETSGRTGASDITMPYHTRFNNEKRLADQWARYNAAWDSAADTYESAQFWTLTTDPKRYDSLAGMVDGIFDAWSMLLEALNAHLDLDHRLDFIRALEFTGSSDSKFPGLPHLHVVVFGVDYLGHSWMKDYWDRKMQHAEIVHFYPIQQRGNSGDWIMRKDGTQFEAQSYLGKYLAKTFESIGENPEDVRSHVDHWGEETWKSSPIWKMALYWATGRQFWDSSHDLKESKPDTLQDVAGLGETKLERLAEYGIKTLSHVRLTDVDELAAIDGISMKMAEKLDDIAGAPSRFDVYNYQFVGAAEPRKMPRYWSEGASHLGVQSVT